MSKIKEVRGIKVTRYDGLGRQRGTTIVSREVARRLVVAECVRTGKVRNIKMHTGNLFHYFQNTTIQSVGDGVYHLTSSFI